VEKAMFGICGELWCFVVDFRLLWDWFPVCAGIYRVLRASKTWMNCGEWCGGYGDKDGG
jgi:hypothetical protein